MSYTKQNFKDGQILKADHLIKIEEGILSFSQVGEDVSGENFTIEGEQITAGVNAEIFNNYSENVATGNYSHAEGHTTQALGEAAHAEGLGTVARGQAAHAEGMDCVASAAHAHAEGANTQVTQQSGHAEGIQTKVWSTGGHAEGLTTLVTGNYAHAEGQSTIAASEYQHVQGRYNIEDGENTYAHIVGNGDSEGRRSNAYTLDWYGNGEY